MERKEIPIVVLMLVASLMLIIPAVSATAISVRWNLLGGTGNYSNVSGSFPYNCTVTNPGSGKVTNVTVIANTSAGVMHPLQSFANTTVAQTAWTGTVTITAAKDGSNQNLSCFAKNTTASAYSSEKGAWHIRLDSTAPLCNITVQYPTVAFQGLQTITYYSSDGLARRATTVDLSRPGATTLTTTAQNGPITLRSNDTIYTGSWTANMTVTDWSGNSCTATSSFTTYLGKSAAQQTAVQGASKTGTNNNKILLLIGIAVLLYFAFKKK